MNAIVKLPKFLNLHEIKEQLKSKNEFSLEEIEDFLKYPLDVDEMFNDDKDKQKKITFFIGTKELIKKWEKGNNFYYLKWFNFEHSVLCDSKNGLVKAKNQKFFFAKLFKSYKKIYIYTDIQAEAVMLKKKMLKYCQDNKCKKIKEIEIVADNPYKRYLSLFANNSKPGTDSIVLYLYGTPITDMLILSKKYKKTRIKLFSETYLCFEINSKDENECILEPEHIKLVKKIKKLTKKKACKSKYKQLYLFRKNIRKNILKKALKRNKKIKKIKIKKSF